MECVVGLSDANDGSVSLRGLPLKPDQRKQIMFYLPDGITPYAEHFVDEILTYFSRVYGVTDEVRDAIVEELDLESVLRKRISELSKGFRRRFLLALALLTPHPLLLLDEPFDGLDLRQTLGVMNLLQNLRQHRRTLFLSIHQLTDAEQICDRFLLLCEGRLLGAGSLDELRAQVGLPDGTLKEVFLALT